MVLILAQLLPQICKLIACKIYDLLKVLDDSWWQLIWSIVFNPTKQSPGYVIVVHGFCPSLIG
jgi:hypothetical protein